MLCKNRIQAVLSSRSGASLLFVMGIMFLLLAIGGSVMAAASSNYGSNIRQNQYNAAVVLNDSIQRNIRHSLQMNSETLPTPVLDFTQSLASNIPIAMYYAHIAENPLTVFELQLGGVAGLVPTGTDRNYSVTIKFPFHPEVNISDSADAMPELANSLGDPDDPFNHRTPATARLSARMIVEVSVFFGAGVNQRVHTTQATYEYRNGVLTDDFFWGNPALMSFSQEVENPNDTAASGEWTMVSYEIFE